MSTHPLPKKRGPKPSGLPLREFQVNFFITPADAAFLNDLSEKLGFKSRSSLVTAIIERLVAGGFSGFTFIKLGYQFTSLLQKCPETELDLFSAVRPLPPLIGDAADPPGAELVPFLKEVTKEIRKETAA